MKSVVTFGIHTVKAVLAAFMWSSGGTRNINCNELRLIKLMFSIFDSPNALEAIDGTHSIHFYEYMEQYD